MNTMEANGVKLSLEESGTGPTVVLVHGIPTDYRVWSAQAAGLSKNYRVISYSRRTAFPNQYENYAASTIESNAQDLEALIAGTGGGPVHLIGHSYGGPVVALFTLKHPESVRSLVLIEPYLPGVIVDQKNVIDSLLLLIRKPSLALSGVKSLNNIRTTLKAISRDDVEKALDSYYPNTWEHKDVKVPLSASARTMMLDNMATFKELLNEVPTFNKEDATRIAPPTLLLAGEHSTRYMKAVAMELQRTIPQSQLAIIRDASHYPHLENPKECNDKILEFLSAQAL